MLSFVRIIALQLDDSCSFCQSAHEVFITSFKILDIPVCAGDGSLAASRLNTTVTEEPFLMNWLILKLGESPFYPLLLYLMTPGSIMLNQRQKAIHQMAPSSVSLESKIQNFTFSEQGYDHCLLGVWISDFCRCNAKSGDYHLWCLHQDADRSHESFQTSSALQHVFFQDDNARPHTFEDLESCHKIWVAKYHVHPSPDLAPSDFCLFGVWGMQSIVRSTTYNDVIRTVRTWLCEQEKAWYQQGVPALVPC